MANIVKGEKALRQLFAGFTEATFCIELGIADPPLIDYLADLLVRFIRVDALHRIRNAEGRRLEEVADMLWEAEQRQARPKRDVYRHIGDVTLFCTGVFPESLSSRQSAASKDQLLDYFQHGKRSYYIASTIDHDSDDAPAQVLRRLSRDFELCTFGLSRVRSEWEKCGASAEWN